MPPLVLLLRPVRNQRHQLLLLVSYLEKAAHQKIAKLRLLQPDAIVPLVPLQAWQFHIQLCAKLFQRRKICSHCAAPSHVSCVARAPSPAGRFRSPAKLQDRDPPALRGTASEACPERSRRVPSEPRKIRSFSP